jgi:hypothetical protein
MAKRGILTHRKTRRLAKFLDVPDRYAVGLLESLWQLTAVSAPRGDIGQLDDEELADALLYDTKEEWLTELEALIKAKWIRRHDTYRLVVIGWSEHCEDAVRKLLTRRGLTFWDGEPPYSGQKVAERPPGQKSEVEPNVATRSDTENHGETSSDVAGLARARGLALPYQALPSQALPLPAIGVPPVVDFVSDYFWKTHFEPAGREFDEAGESAAEFIEFWDEKNWKSKRKAIDGERLTELMDEWAKRRLEYIKQAPTRVSLSDSFWRVD